jgi:hypothetical protein
LALKGFKWSVSRAGRFTPGKRTSYVKEEAEYMQPSEPTVQAASYGHKNKEKKHYAGNRNIHTV